MPFARSRDHLRRYAVLVGLLMGVGHASIAAATAQEGEELIGTVAPQWETPEWVNSKPLTLDQLRGKVVLVRWWTGPECPYCAASAPSLSAWHHRYRDKGLVVVGFYHHKSPTPLSRQDVVRLMKRYRFTFPVAIDPEWRTLKRWWLDDSQHRWTSVSFLLDQAGVIRHIHPGGAYSEEDVQTLTSLIEELLGPPRQTATASEGSR